MQQKLISTIVLFFRPRCEPSRLRPSKPLRPHPSSPARQVGPRARRERRQRPRRPSRAPGTTARLDELPRLRFQVRPYGNMLVMELACRRDLGTRIRLHGRMLRTIDVLAASAPTARSRPGGYDYVSALRHRRRTSTSAPTSANTRSRQLVTHDRPSLKSRDGLLRRKQRGTRPRLTQRPLHTAWA
jgi:hypothetical protein